MATPDRSLDSRLQRIPEVPISARDDLAQSHPRPVSEDRQSPRLMKFRSRAR